MAVLASQFSQAREIHPVKKKRGRPVGRINQNPRQQDHPVQLSLKHEEEAVGGGMETVLRMWQIWRALGQFLHCILNVRLL